jgi:thymidylate synthase (FAD)
MSIMNNNKVELIGWYGGDVEHACSAWTSTSRELTEEKKARIPQLLSHLALNGHETPFEKSCLHFLLDSDIASHIHLLKHRVAVSINAESARYKEIKEDKFYVPWDWEGIKVTSLPAAAEDMTWGKLLGMYNELGNTYYHACIKDIELVLGRKRAKETARYFKTYSSQIESDIMFNFRSFVHFQRLRNHPDAQQEIRDIAREMLELVKKIENNPFEYSLNSFDL